MASQAEQIREHWTQLGTALFTRSRPDDGVSLSNNQLLILYVLDAEGTLRVSDLAERVGASAPAVSRTLKGLVAKEYLARVTDESDRRASLISLAPAGRKVVRTHQARTLAGIEQMLDRLPKAERREVLEHFSRLAELLVPRP